MDSLFSIDAKHIYLMLQVLFPVSLVWEAVVSFIAHVTRPWRDLFWICFDIYLNLWTGIGSFSMKMLVLPLRIYNAIQREDMVVRQMQEMEDLVLESERRNRELECRLEQLITDCEQFEELLRVAEREKKAILKKYQMIQLQVLDLQEENETLRAWEEKITKGIRGGKRIVLQPVMLKDKEVGYKLPLVMCESDADHSPSKEERISKGIHDDVQYLGNDNDAMLSHGNHNDTQYVGNMHNGMQYMQEPSKTPFLDSKQNLVMGIHGEKHIMDERAIREGREAALSSSLFSVFLSLLVGTIAWQAQDPCIPLVLAVFMVVCLSLITVVQFLWSIGSGPGSDAVALLSFNWFILGTLAYPVLPSVARMVAPIAGKMWQWFLRLVGIDYIVDKLRNLSL